MLLYTALPCKIRFLNRNFDSSTAIVPRGKGEKDPGLYIRWKSIQLDQLRREIYQTCVFLSAKFLIEEAKIQSRGETGWRSHLSKGQNDLFGETPWIRKVSPWKRTGSFERKNDRRNLHFL